MSGHIKNSIRAKWEAVFEDERRGVMHDPAEHMIELLSMPGLNMHLERQCTCKHPCCWWMQNGPYPKAQDFRNDRGGLRENGDQCFYCGVPDPSTLEYDPRKHDLFVWED
ncbi:hypothetical protein E8E11_001987 [Didymella keratinophila]|nr:hypothetical protein E8E11_001987 [Didymella keratinophila]